MRVLVALFICLFCCCSVSKEITITLRNDTKHTLRFKAQSGNKKFDLVLKPGEKREVTVPIVLANEIKVEFLKEK